MTQRRRILSQTSMLLLIKAWLLKGAPDLIASRGYPVEVHRTVTDDHYNIELHRIPHGREESSDVASRASRQAILLQHGILSSSFTWVMGEPTKALGFLLADAGYDVWLGNFRGNGYSRGFDGRQDDVQHYWNFSWDEMGKYDIPAMLKKIKSVTGQGSLRYVGHSMGTTAYLVAMNECEEYRGFVASAHLLAPVAHVQHVDLPLVKKFAKAASLIVGVLARVFGLGQLELDREDFQQFHHKICEEGTFSRDTCEVAMSVLGGLNPDQTNFTLLPEILQHFPASASKMTTTHYAQMTRGRLFSKYDFGWLGNLLRYGQKRAPSYSFSAVTPPVCLYWAESDMFATPEDLSAWSSLLPNVVDDYRVSHPTFNHHDFVFGVDAEKLLYRRILENMQRF